MMMSYYIGLQRHKWSNYWRTVLLLLAFPTLVCVVVWLIARGSVVVDGGSDDVSVTQLFAQISLGVFPIIALFAGIGFLFQRQLIFTRSGARIWTDADGRDVPVILESLCISRGLPVPRLGIIDDDALNAFALGRIPHQSRIVLTRGLVNHLTKEQLEAVIAHELTHIINKDVLTMTILTVFVGAISWIGSLVLRSLSSDSSTGYTNQSKNDGRIRIIMLLLGLGFTLLSSLFLPLLLFAVSRKREYLADAGAVELTKDAEAMIGALLAISANPGVKTIDANESIAAMCIISPLSGSGLSRRRHHLRSTHPSIESRIDALRAL